MMPEDVSAVNIASLDDYVIAITSNRWSRQKFSWEITRSKQVKVLKTKIESALDVLKDGTLHSDKGDKMQSIIFKFQKLYCSERFNSPKQKDITDFLKAL